MSDTTENDILAKAEARRRRILENSKARLEKISSKKDDGETFDIDKMKKIIFVANFSST